MAFFSPSNSISTLRTTVAVGRSACGGRGRPWGFRRRHGLPHRIPAQKHKVGRSRCPSTERAKKELQNDGENRQFHRTVAEISSVKVFASELAPPEMSKGARCLGANRCSEIPPTHRFSRKLAKNSPQKTVPMERASKELQNAVSNAEIRPFFAENESFQVRLVVSQ